MLQVIAGIRSSQIMNINVILVLRLLTAVGEAGSLIVVYYEDSVMSLYRTTWTLTINRNAILFSYEVSLLDHTA